jgi:tetrahydromethanopterin S-methyltransferase subunit C
MPSVGVISKGMGIITYVFATKILTLEKWLHAM